MKTIPIKQQTIDMSTGEVVEQRAVPFKILPPAKGVCQVCAKGHDPLLPHDRQSLYYQYTFYGAIGRWPTWADACAHCDEAVTKNWRAAMKSLGHEWTEPPDRHLPVRDLGPEPA